MYLKQHTLKAPISFEGVGLHTGASCRVTVQPAEENHGFQFRRTDLPGQPVIPALLESVVDSRRSTTIGVSESARVQTIEHLLAALAGLQIDNALIDIEGPEVPILDGSAQPFVLKIKEVGALSQKDNREFYVIQEPIHYHDQEGNIDLAALQFDDYRLTVMIDYNSKQLGIQHATMVRLEDFEREIAPNRTFCFWHEIEDLLKRGLIKGGNLDNSIVIVDREVPQAELDSIARNFGREALGVAHEGILNNVELRFGNEPARHKLLDLIGDLTLLGTPLKTQIMAVRPGHTSNIAFARKIQSEIKQRQLIKKYQKRPSSNVVFDINAISNILPHRYPFLLVDRITEFSETSIEGIKNCTLNEPYFTGHFPKNPIMPGVLIVEAMAQVGGILLLNIIDNPKEYWVYLLGLEKVRFKRPVTPGDQIHFKLDLMNLRRGICKMSGRAYVDEQLVCEAEITASLVNKNS